MIRAVFLDRDGVINRKPRDGEYVTRWEDLHLIPGAVEGIGLLNGAGFRVIVVTNQRCVAKGLITVAELEEMHNRMSDLLAQSGANVDAIYYCPHEVEPVCRCRKPAPGMLLDASRDLGIDLAASWMIGDSEIDVEAGKNAGCKTARLLDASDIADCSASPAASTSADITAPSLRDAVSQMLRREAPGTSPAFAATRSQFS